MGHARSVKLLDSVDAVAAGADFTWEGGRSVLVTTASTYTTALVLQLKHVDGTYVDIGSNISANAVSAGIDLPAGTYRMNMSGGTASNISATLNRVPQ